jgi:hypothetical protein|tara:strand:+ start:367 stop:783 length:417 start_codon:yes stop_codon:yes gene_type:complete
MSKDIYGDEFKEEIRKLKELDKKILRCKGRAEKIRHICKTDPTLNGMDVSIKKSIRVLLNLSKSLIQLTDAVDDYESTRDDTDDWILTLLNNNENDKKNFKKMKSLRSGAEKLTKTYDETIRMFAKQYRKERERNGRK